MAINLFTLTDVLRDLNIDQDNNDIVEKVKRIDLGLTAEDEFQALITWLGRVPVCHKIENIPAKSKIYPKVRIPDLFATFEVEDNQFQTAIEVKSNSNNKLSWRPDYYNEYLRYQEITNNPVLVAWKHTNIQHWTLNALSSFEIVNKNYNLSFEKAMKDNLLSLLAGDKGFQLYKGTSLCFEADKIKIVSKNADSKEELWKAKITKAFFTDGQGKKYDKFPSGIWPLFLSSDISSHNAIEKDVIKQTFIYNPEDEETSTIQFLHKALPIIIHFESKQEKQINWRERLVSGDFPITGNELRKALSETIGTFTHHTITFNPTQYPDFLEKLKSKKSKI